ncbi:sugar ABC transporter permease [Rhodoglobus aureus]|uniref:carbohydrate ABC transporter permease n=1 Tax=Rhodoglobus aureus TaxID=191497 RepID=UPI0031D3569D
MSKDIWFLLPAVVFVLATVAYPLVYNVGQSFFDVGIKEIVQGGADFVGFDNYSDQFARDAFWRATGISVLYTSASVILTLLVGLGLALLFNADFPGRNLLRAFVLAAWILPTVVSANLWRFILDGTYGLFNAILQSVGLIDDDVFWLGDPFTALIGVTAATSWSFAPFAMILLLAGLQSISPTLYEAALIDGASAWQQFWRVTLPILRPVVLTTALICFIYTFKTFDTVFLMTGGGPGGATTILPIYAYDQAFTFYDFGKAAVATTVLLIIPIMLSIPYFRSLRKEDRS